MLTYAAAAWSAARAGDLRAVRRYVAAVQRIGADASPEAVPWYAAQVSIVLGRAALEAGEPLAARARIEEARQYLGHLVTEGVLRDELEELADLVAGTRSTAWMPSSMALTAAEVRVLQLLPTHLSLGQIAEELHVSRNTIKTQVAATYRKLQAATRAEAVRRGHELGLLTGGDGRPGTSPDALIRAGGCAVRADEEAEPRRWRPTWTGAGDDRGQCRPAGTRGAWPPAGRLSPAQRAALGRAARTRVPRSSHADPGDDGRQARSPCAPRGAGGAARARARADPARADGRRRSPSTAAPRCVMAGRPGAHAARPGSRPGLRRRPPAQLRRSSRRPSAASSSTSTTSTRRCPARGSGTSSAWPRASWSPGGSEGSPHEGASADRPSTPWRRTALAMRAVRARWARSTSGTHGSSADEIASVGFGSLARTAQQRRGSSGAGSEQLAKARDADQPAGRSASSPASSTAGSRVHRRPSARRAAHGSAAGRRARPVGGDPRRAARRLRGRSLAPGPAAAARAVPGRRHGAQGGRRRQRRDPLLDPPADGRDDADPLVLQAKEAERSVLERATSRSQRRSANRASAWCGPAADAGGERHLPRLEPRDGIDGRGTGLLRPSAAGRQGVGGHHEDDPRRAHGVRRICGWTLARAHARSGDRIAIAAYLGSSDVFDQALVQFAEAYADRNERDHAALVKAIAEGRLQATSGV